MRPRLSLLHKRLGGSEVRRWASVGKVPGSNPGEAGFEPEKIKRKRLITPERVELESWEWARWRALEEISMMNETTIL